MIDGLKPYPAYKDSWARAFVEVPDHWDVRRQRNVVSLLVSNVDKLTVEGEVPVRLCNYVDVYKHDHITASLPFMHATARSDEMRFRLELGDVVITKDSETWNDIGVPALVEYAAPDLLCGYHLAILRPRPSVMHGPYLLRALQTPHVAGQFHVEANGVTRYGLSHAVIQSVALPVPPLGEQVAIARFIDHADRQIRRYIGAKQKLIALLDEQKRAIIHSAVTRGLDPDVRLKPSGVEWLGDVPEHWDVVRLSRLVALTTGFPFKSEGFTQDVADIRLLRGINVAPGHVRWDDVVRWPQRDRETFGEYELAPGDLVLGMDRPVIQGGVRVAMVDDRDVPSLLLQRVARIRPHSELRAEYAELLLAGKNFSDYLTPIFTGISVPHLSPEQIGSFQLALPPIGEQEKIVDRVAQDAIALRSATGRAQGEIALLREYRTRLIADVITGKVDVGDAAADLPDWEGDEVADPDIEVDEQ